MGTSLMILLTVKHKEIDNANSKAASVRYLEYNGEFTTCSAISVTKLVQIKH